MLYPTLKIACLCWGLCCWPLTPEQDNPLWLPSTAEPGSYGRLFEKVLSVIGDRFEIAESNRYEGRVETSTRVFLRQTGGIARLDRAVVRITPDEQSGFLVDV